MPNEFPRSKGPWVDDGSPATVAIPCPNCGSDKYIQTVSTESCAACGLRFDYWGSGGNEVHVQYLQRMQRRREEAEYAESVRWREDRDDVD